MPGCLGLGPPDGPAPWPRALILSTLVPEVPACNIPVDTWPQREGLGGEQASPLLTEGTNNRLFT